MCLRIVVGDLLKRPVANSPVEQYKDEQWNEEEDDDDEDEVELGPGVVHGRQAHRRLLVWREVCHDQNGRGQDEGHKPRDEACEAGLALGPHHASLRARKRRMGKLIVK